QKAWLGKHGFPLVPHRSVDSADDIAAAVRAFGASFVKARRGGYDGRSQVRVVDAGDAAEAWRALGERPAVAEQGLELAGELSVMIARRPSGDVVVFPAALNHHQRQVLAWSVLPAPIDPALVGRAV